ncbi:uncharacterized protein PHACADRAFT_266361 [Phanerochaete carnosa HHB-10118-sp]|uniref:Uncharacterized protein n=1 Tax=Phanerochaete carnosa (strain HHB-10118-sp) TaxID=650164 RepID=K5WE51_PHACS|nr:uncharacterized protein PHACADRAFT_266361 [Phanerochaete carnosa HHB-10118-sp]EKM48442.1 hypothetical protein PHACADRAFT_266361 [Phanerochaete carnosa HHB-10118-sp]
MGRLLPDSELARTHNDEAIGDEITGTLRVAILLVEQHADVNTSVEDETPLLKPHAGPSSSFSFAMAHAHTLQESRATRFSTR